MIFFCTIAHILLFSIFFLYFHLCGCIMAAVTQAVNTFTQADVILQGDSLFICMHRSPTCMLPSLTQWFELAGVWLLVAELQVQTNLSSPHYKETIVSVRQGHRRGSRKLGNIDTRMTGPWKFIYQCFSVYAVCRRVSVCECLMINMSRYVTSVLDRMQISLSGWLLFAPGLTELSRLASVFCRNQ